MSNNTKDDRYILVGDNVLSKCFLIRKAFKYFQGDNGEVKELYIELKASKDDPVVKKNSLDRGFTNDEVRLYGLYYVYLLYTPHNNTVTAYPAINVKGAKLPILSIPIFQKEVSNTFIFENDKWNDILCEIIDFDYATKESYGEFEESYIPREDFVKMNKKN